MNLYCTEMQAIDIESGELKTFAGPMVPAITFKDAHNYCKNNMSNCKPIGSIISIYVVDGFGASIIDDYDTFKWN